MTFIRLLGSLLGIAVIATLLTGILYVTIDERNWLGGIIAAGIFGPILIICCLQWWKNWSQRRETMATESAFNRKYFRLDYFLLIAMALCALPIFWLRLHPPSVVADAKNVRTLALATIGATVCAAFIWQPDSFGKITNTRSSAMLGIMATAIGMWLLIRDMNSNNSFLGYGLLYLGVWSLLRASLMFVLDRKTSMRGG